jgi:hypothetical protein
MTAFFRGAGLISAIMQKSEYLSWGDGCLNPNRAIADLLLSGMNISNKNKIYGAVVCAGVAALIIDRAYFSPHAASAGLRRAPEIPPAAVEAQPVPELSLTNEGTISNRLKSVAISDWNRIYNVFAPSSAWVNSVEPALARPDQFEITHKLSAVMSSHNGGTAIVNGQFIRIGEIVDGFTLVSVGPRSAVFLKNGKRVELSLGI